MEVLRTPPDRFEGLDDCFAARYHEVDGVRVAYVDEGAGQPVLMLHGQLSWSYLFRKSIPPLIEAGYRCIAPDLIGFGRSDKPAAVSWYSFQRHVTSLASLISALDLRDITLLFHDWGGPLGFALLSGPLANRFARVVSTDTMVLTGTQEMTPEWGVFRDLIARYEPVPVGRLVRMACLQRPPLSLVQAYNAPFPDATYQAGVKAFPGLVPLKPDAPGAAEGRDALAALAARSMPALLLWSEVDSMFPLEVVGQALEAAFPAAASTQVVPRSGAFLFEDQGELIGQMIRDWLAREARADPGSLR